MMMKETLRCILSLFLFSSRLGFLTATSFGEMNHNLLLSNNRTTTTSFSAQQQPLYPPTGDGVITIPLTPHSVVRQRNLKEARRLEKINRDAGYPARKRRHSRSRSLSHDESEEEHYNAQQVAELLQGYGTHYADLWCGTPPQRQTVIVDTGSGVTAFPCSGCKDCGVPDYHIDALFDETTSTSFAALGCDECLRGSCHSSDNTCTIGQAYQEGSSWNAFEAVDLCYVGGLHSRAVDAPAQDDEDDLNPFDARLFAFNMKFGCQTHLTGLFITQLADGIMGMDVAEASYWWQMYNAQKIQHKAFSLCFSRKIEAEREGTESGAMSLGGTDVRLHKTKMVYSATTESSHSGFYVVHIKKVYLREPGGGTSAKSTDPNLQTKIIDMSEAELNSGRVIVDSGTTDTYFSRRFGVSFSKAWKEMTGEDYNHNPLDITEEELLRTKPTIIFQLNGDIELNTAVVAGSDDEVQGLAKDVDPENPYDVLLAIPPNHYYEFDDEINKWVSRFYVDDSSGGVFGANSMMGHDVYFDVERNRIGWAESDCDYTNMVAKYMDGYTPPANEDVPAPVPVPEDPTVPDPSNEDTYDEDTYDEDTYDEDTNDGDTNDEDVYDDYTNDEDGKEPDYEIPNGGEDDEIGDDDINTDFTGEWAEGYGSITDQGGFCSGIACQLIVTLLVISSVGCVALKLVRKPSGPNYDLADGTELELTGNGISSGSFEDGDFTNGGGIKYRNQSEPVMT